MFSCMKTGKENETLKHGRMLLQELIASCNGKCNLIRSFSNKQLTKATNNYHDQQIIVRDSEYKLYKGFLEHRPISVKKYVDICKNKSRLLESAITDIIIGSQMSVHKNVLKLIGCCLETTFPIVVYEFAGCEILSTRVNFGNNSTSGENLKPLSWKSRIKIAADISNAIAYLHTALSRPVVLRDIRLSTIILSDENIPKLIDFSLSISIPDGQSHIMTEVVRGRSGHLAPEYMCSGYVSDKLDVYDFGIQIHQILTGKKTIFRCEDKHYFLPEYVYAYVENQNLFEIVDPTLLNNDIEQQQLLAVGKLALSCTRNKADERPTMTDVARELRLVYESISS